MANPEIELISNIIENTDFSHVRKMGITPEFFRTEEGAAAFNWLWKQYHDIDHRGEIPDEERFLRKFPSFDYCPSRNSIPALISELQDSHLEFEMDRISGEIQGLLDEKEDPRSVLQAYLPQLRDLNYKTSENSGLFIRDSFALLRQEYETTRDSGGVTGIPFPWEPLNKATGGMQSEQFIVVFGRPKQMKTWVALKIAAESYLFNRRVYIFSKEMRREDLARRLASIITNVDYAKLKSAGFSESEEEDFFDQVEHLSDWEDDFEGRNDSRKPAICLDSDKGRRQASTVDDITVRAEKFEPDLIVIDGFYLMRDGRTRSTTIDWKNIGHISQDLKGMAQYLECPVLGTTQANRANAKISSDDMTDLSFADNIGQDADLAMRIFKGPNPKGVCKYALALTFPGVREADLNPFLINANPGKDFSLLTTDVNIDDFIKQHKKLMDEEENAGKKRKGDKQPVHRFGNRGGLQNGPRKRLTPRTTIKP